MIAAFPAAEIADAMLPGFGCNLLWFFAMPYDRDQGQAVWRARIGVPSRPVRSLHVQPTASSKAILIDGQSMAGIRDAV
jgi:hypothetical protein